MSRKPFVVVTPWYPSEDGPYDGTFVREAVSALGHPPEETLIVHLRNVPLDQEQEAHRYRTDLGEVLRICVPTGPLTPRDEMARAQRRALVENMPPELLEADVVHAHVGMPSGWAVSGVLPETTRLVTTEHASYLPRILRTAVGAQMYGEVVERSERLLVVTEREARTLRTRYPAAAHRISTIGNPVDDVRFLPRPERVEALDRWLYVGNLARHKGVHHLVPALAAWVAAHPDRPTTLTVVGDGPDREAVATAAEKLGVQDRVDLVGPVEHADMPEVFAAHDMLLHLSAKETFGLTVVEAAMTGLPVVVTTCGGPEETLSDAATAGLVRFVSTEPDPADVVSAVEALEGSLRIADPAGVRDVLVQRYGTESFGRRLQRVLDGGSPEEPPAPDAPVVLGLAFSPRASRRVAASHLEALRAGGRAVLVTTQLHDRASSDSRVEVIDLSRHELRNPVHGLEQLLLWAAPRFVIKVLRKPVWLASRVPGPHRRPALRVFGRLGALLGSHQKVAAAVRSRVLQRFVYSWMDPWRLAHYTMRHRGQELARVEPDIIVLGDDVALPLAWRLARAVPDAVVISTPSDATVRALVTDAAAKPRVRA